jgi:alpha-tubulin suppressor-like RCC1 family protein
MPGSLQTGLRAWKHGWALVLAGAMLTACDDDERKAADAAILRRWLLCDECTGRELDSVRAPGRQVEMVRLLAQALAGPPFSRRGNVRVQLEATYDRLAARAVEEGRTLPLTREQYVAHYLGNYEATYQARAIIGLVAIGTPEAKDVLRNVAERVRNGELRYRADVVEELSRAVPSWRYVTAGVERTCAIMTDGKAYCWGRNDLGQLGDNSTDPRLTPSPVAGNLRFSTISVGSGGGFHTCGISQNKAYCWGSNARGELGDGTTTNRPVPTPVAGGLQFVGVTAGGNHSCAWTGNNRGYCWGGNHAGQLGDGTTTDKGEPVPVTATLRLRSMDAGNFHTCGDSLGGQLQCWGSNEYGQLADGTITDRRDPVQAAGPVRFAPIGGKSPISLGAFHGCGLEAGGHLTGGRAYCVGRNDEGRLGDGTTTRRSTLVAVHDGHRFLMISAGERHTCGVRSGSRTVLCWGDNSFGQLGDGTTQSRPLPAPVVSSLRFAVVAAGAGHTCAVSLEGEAFCWGRNAEGQLGDGSRDNRVLPTPVTAP